MQEKEEQQQEDSLQAGARTRHNSAPVAVIGDGADAGASSLALVDDYDDSKGDLYVISHQSGHGQLHCLKEHTTGSTSYSPLFSDPIYTVCTAFT